MDDESSFLVDDDQIIVLEDYAERDILRDRFGVGWRRRRDLDPDFLTDLEDIAGRSGDRIDGGVTRLDEFLELTPRESPEARGAEHVETQPLLFGRDHKQFN
jgi:hypothetical protein